MLAPCTIVYCVLYQSLEVDGSNVKAIHSLVHVFYMGQQWEEGIELLRSTTALWMVSLTPLLNYCILVN